MKPTKPYFICFTVRSGSSLLCELLKQTGVAGDPQEYFNHGNSPENPSGDVIQDYAQFIEDRLKNHITPNGVFGAKIGGGQLHDFIPRLLSIDGMQDASLDVALDSVFPNLKYIWLTRRNKVRQAVSHWMAIQSGRWHSPDAMSNPEPEYVFDAIDHLVQELIMREAVWADYFSQYRITPYTVVYEDYIQDMDSTIRGILDYLEIELPSAFKLKSPNLKQTANDMTEAWVQRYREEKQSDWWATFW